MQIDDPVALEGLLGRLRALRPDAERVWGTMTAGEMLCHLGDGSDWLLDRRAIEGSDVGRARPVLKWIALYSPLRWARGTKTHPSADPKVDGTKPTDFEADRTRAIEGLRAVAALPPEDLPAIHPAFGPMTPRDWYRSVYRHHDHHLRQFSA